MLQWTWASASSRGVSHLKTGVQCQDAKSCSLLGRNADVLLTVVSDGAGSAVYGGQGASLVCRLFTERARAHFKNTVNLPLDDDIIDWMGTVRKNISIA